MTHLSLYETQLGSSFSELPPVVRELHALRQRTVWRGEADVTRGPSDIVQLAAWLTDLPPTGWNVSLTVTFSPDGDGKSWHRSFAGHTFRSHQRAGDGGHILERVGPVEFAFRPNVVEHQLELILTAVRFMRIPVPAMLHPEIKTCEYEHNGRYHFNVEASLPWFGLLIRYGGWLMPDA